MREPKLVSIFLAMLLLIGVVYVLSSSSREDLIADNAEMEKQESFDQIVNCDGLPNLFQPSQGIYSGGQPEFPDGFRQLSELGIKTIISVDGAQPRIDDAEKFGLTYVHLPHGYDGISQTQTKRLAKAVDTLQGPIYIHCHHGKHRSPAAAAVVCVSLDRMSTNEALLFLEKAGTSSHYKGLYRSVKNSKPISRESLDGVKANFPAIAKPTPIVQSMVAIERHFDSLIELVERNGVAPAKSPDLDVRHETLLLSEQFTELMRQKNSFGNEYDILLSSSQKHAQELLKLLSIEGQNAFPRDEAEKILKSIRNDCRSCHQEFRNNGA